MTGLSAPVNAVSCPQAGALLEAAAVCRSSALHGGAGEDEDGGGGDGDGSASEAAPPTGSPLERMIGPAASKLGLGGVSLRYDVTGMLPFDPSRKYMAVRVRARPDTHGRWGLLAPPGGFAERVATEGGTAAGGPAGAAAVVPLNSEQQAALAGIGAAQLPPPTAAPS